MGWREEGGEEGDVPWTLLPLWVRRGFDGAGVGREFPQSPAPWESWWVEHVGLSRPGSRVRPNPGPAVPGPWTGPRGMGVGEKVGEADRDGGRAKGGGAPALSEGPSTSPHTVVVVVVAVVVAVDKGAEGAANNLGDRGRSYGGPQREGRVIVQGG